MNGRLQSESSGVRSSERSFSAMMEALMTWDIPALSSCLTDGFSPPTGKAIQRPRPALSPGPSIGPELNYGLAS